MDATATDLHFLELTELAARIEAREVSPVAVTRAQLDRIAALDGALGSYAQVMTEVAMAQAETAEAEVAASTPTTAETSRRRREVPQPSQCGDG